VADTPDLRAVVRGASGGIGAICARGLRARGERLFLFARREHRLRSLVDEPGGEPHAIVLPLEGWPSPFATTSRPDMIRSPDALTTASPLLRGEGRAP
jgi:NAD(P)-dependent dehydrogenase (short-subunit alcohol dehydrogenase family)